MGLADKAKQRAGDDPSQIDPDDAYGGNLDLPLKPGEYLVEVQSDNTEERGTSSGGSMINVHLKIEGPEYANRRIFERFVIDCPSNREFEDEEYDRLTALYQAGGGEGWPAQAEDLVGKRLIVRTGLEEGEYKGETTFDAVVWGVKPVEEGPPSGAHPDNKQPKSWKRAVAHAKGELDEDESSDASGGEQSSFSEDEVPF